jgi:hypothetical protein
MKSASFLSRRIVIENNSDVLVILLKPLKEDIPKEIQDLRLNNIGDSIKFRFNPETNKLELISQKYLKTYSKDLLYMDNFENIINISVKINNKIKYYRPDELDIAVHEVFSNSSGSISSDGLLRLTGGN